MHQTLRNILAIPALALSLSLGVSFADSLSRITNISVDAQGNIQMDVTGEGFDPMMRSERDTQGRYTVVIEGDDVTLDNAVLAKVGQFSTQMVQKTPAISGVTYYQKANEPGIRIIMQTARKLSPHVVSNTGNRIVLALVGDKSKAGSKPASSTARSTAGNPQLRDGSGNYPEKSSLYTAEQRKLDEQREAEERRQMAISTAAGKKKMVVVPPSGGTNSWGEQSTETEMPSVDFETQPAPTRKSSTARSTVASSHSSSSRSSTSQSSSSQSSSGPKSSGRTSSSRSSASPAMSAQPLPSESVQRIEPEMRQTVPMNDPVATEMAPLTNGSDADIASSFPSLDDDRSPVALKTRPSGFDMTPDEAANTTPLDNHFGTMQPQLDMGDSPSMASASPGTMSSMTTTTTTTSSSMSAPMSSGSSIGTMAPMNMEGTGPVIRNAWNAIQQGDLASSEAMLKTHLQTQPQDAAARYLLARVYLTRAGETRNETQARAYRTQAKQELERLATNGEAYQPAFTSLMDVYLTEGNSAQANALLEQAKVRWPENGMVWYYEGQNQENAGNFDAAREAYSKALTSDANNVEFHYQLARLELKSGRTEAARWELNQALALSPDDNRLWKLMGYISEKQNNTEAASEYYKRALNPDAMINYGRLLEKQNKPDEAMAVYQAAENLASDDPDILFNLGMIYSGMKRKDRAESMLKKYITLEKKLPANERDGRLAQAENALRDLKKTR